MNDFRIDFNYSETHVLIVDGDRTFVVEKNAIKLDEHGYSVFGKEAKSFHMKIAVDDKKKYTKKCVIKILKDYINDS